MNNVNKLTIALVSVAMFGMVSGVANAATTRGKSSVEVTSGLSIAPAKDGNGTKGSDLYFGQVLVPTKSAAKIVVKPNGSSVATGTTAIKQGHPATFQITGLPGKSVSVVLDKKSTMKGGPKGKYSLPVTNFTSSKIPALSAKGVANFTVGATVTIPKGAKIGDYTGTFGVTVNY